MHEITIAQPPGGPSFGLPQSTSWHVNVSGFPWGAVNHPMTWGGSAFVACLLALLLIRTILYGVIVHFTQSAIRALPADRRPEYFKYTWLLMIPLVPFVWNYFVFLPLARAYRTHLAERPKCKPRDGGWAVSLGMCICCDATLLPYISLAALVGWLLLVIITLTHLIGLRRAALDLATEKVHITDAEASMLQYVPVASRTSRQAPSIRAASIFLAAGFGLPAIYQICCFASFRLIDASNHIPQGNIIWFYDFVCWIINTIGAFLLLLGANRLASGARAVGIRAPLRFRLARVGAAVVLANMLLNSAMLGIDPQPATVRFGEPSGLLPGTISILSAAVYPVAILIFAASAAALLRDKRIALNSAARALLTFSLSLVAMVAVALFWVTVCEIALAPHDFPIIFNVLSVPAPSIEYVLRNLPVSRLLLPAAFFAEIFSAMTAALAGFSTPRSPPAAEFFQTPPQTAF
jgi:hypothetical protein